MQEAPQQFINQLTEIHKWSSHWSRRLYAVQNSLEYEIISMKEMPEKIALLRASLYEIDKSLEILSANCLSVALTQVKEENEQIRNGNSDQQFSGELNGEGS